MIQPLTRTEVGFLRPPPKTMQVRGLLTALLLLAVIPADACSPAGHLFVAAAALGELKGREDPAARNLARILTRYRWTYYWGSEGPDIVQKGRGYRASHWFPLYTVEYEHPEAFDLEKAQPYFTALLHGAWTVSWHVDAGDVQRHRLLLVRSPRKDWNEVSLAFACGYITHLLADYFCHAPAKRWWDASPELRDAVFAATGSRSYGVVQELFAVMLWERGRKEYGIPDNAEAELGKLPLYHLDNGVLPYCGLACSKSAYTGWPKRVLDVVDPSYYDVCAAPMLHGGGPLAGCVRHERRRVQAMMKHMDVSLDDAIRTSDAAFHWQATYRNVVAMIARVFAEAAAEVRIRDSARPDVCAEARKETDTAGAVIEVPSEPGSTLCLALYRDWAVRRYKTRTGEDGPVTAWGQPPSGARFDFDVLRRNGRSVPVLLTDGPWKTSAPGFVRGTFTVQFPTVKPIFFEAQVRLHGKSARKKSDGVTFRLEVALQGSPPRTLFERHVRGANSARVRADLSEFAGKTVRLSLVSDAGLRNDPGWDIAEWVDPRVRVGGAGL
ncbi:MAG: zinc dependent phospholipase C family protein [Kiritimatiellaeota bacterium]|nr:zinc dependent phospholipase C family protein [Kiritimatiellota bacterium]